MNKAISFFFTSIFLSLFIVSCVTPPEPAENRNRRRPSPDRGVSRERNTSHAARDNTSARRKSAREVENTRNKILEGAEKFKGATSLVVNGRRFSMDCSGVVAAIYYYAGIDLQKHFPQYTGSGTERIYKTLKDRRLIKKTWLPKTGDIVFWDNTFDRNNNNRIDDPLTHVGIVVAVDSRGNITYVHHHYRRGIVFEYMNIRQKNEESQMINGERVIINSPMRMRSSSRSNHNWLAGQLVNSFGEAYYLD